MFIDLHYFRIGLEDDERWMLYYPREDQDSRTLVTVQSESSKVPDGLTDEEKDALIRGLIMKIQGYMKMETKLMQAGCKHR